ncbi:MAG: ATPase domain-containing protein [Candidatus Bathyarchaeia archaeon]|jgi:KaiC/GvpD/RAD55 family RecA-like ATPase
MKMVSTEVFPGASFLIDGEIPRGIYLLIGNSGAGKTSFCKTFIARGLSNKETGIYLSTDEDCGEIQASIQKLMEDQDGMKGDLRLVDAYSWRVRGATGNEPFVTVNPANLTGVMIACQKICQDVSKPRFVFDSITDLAIQSNPDTTLKFLQLVTAKMRSLNALAFFTLIPTSHDSMFVSTVRTMFNGIFEMRLDDTGSEITRMFRIFSIKGVKHQTRWIIFNITERGISMVDDSTPRCAWCGGIIPYEPHKETIKDRDYTFHATGCSDNFKRKLALERLSEQLRPCSSAHA